MSDYSKNVVVAAITYIYSLFYVRQNAQLNTDAKFC